MLKAARLYGYGLNATDGTAGSLKDLFFDAENGAVRYLVVSTGTWLTGRRVLITPEYISKVDHEKKCINIAISKHEAENCPSPVSDEPASRHFSEPSLMKPADPVYWGGPFRWGWSPYLSHDDDNTDKNQGESAWNTDLHSTRDLRGYDVITEDNQIWHVKDFLIDEVSWVIKELIVNTGKGHWGKKIHVPRDRIERIDWRRSEIRLGVPSHAVPNPTIPIGRDP